MRKYWRGALGLVVILLALTVGLKAYTGWVNVSVGAGIWGDATFMSEWWPEGYTYTMVKVDGFPTTSCGPGFNDNGWCADNAHSYLGGWLSHAIAYSQFMGCGWFSATSHNFLDGNQVGDRNGSAYYQCAEDTPPDGTPDECPDGCVTPIVIATGVARAYTLTSPAKGVLFDLDADGDVEQVAWTPPESEVAFLARDVNGNGVIDDGAELFGNHTLPGATNGFAALIALPGHDADGSLSAEDPLFAELLLWHDRNHNGFSEPSELQPASDVLEAIGLGYSPSFPRRDGSGNRYRYAGWARASEVGKSGRVPPNRQAWRTEIAREFRIYDVIVQQ